MLCYTLYEFAELYFLLESDIKMETFYLIDFENVHSEGLENIDTLDKTDHVHIFYTENASTIRLDIILTDGIEIVGHKVPARKQSLDMHLVSYLGHLLGINKGKQCSYVIISKDKDYDNIIKFWQENGFENISRNQEIPNCNAVNQNSKNNVAKRESQVRSFFGQHFKEKIYVDKKEEIIQIILGATTRQQVNNELLKLYSDGNRVKEMIKTLQPLIKELPGK